MLFLTKYFKVSLIHRERRMDKNKYLIMKILFKLYRLDINK